MGIGIPLPRYLEGTRTGNHRSPLQRSRQAVRDGGIRGPIPSAGTCRSISSGPAHPHKASASPAIRPAKPSQGGLRQGEEAAAGRRQFGIHLRAPERGAQRGGRIGAGTQRRAPDAKRGDHLLAIKRLRGCTMRHSRMRGSAHHPAWPGFGFADARCSSALAGLVASRASEQARAGGISAHWSKQRRSTQGGRRIVCPARP